MNESQIISNVVSVESSNSILSMVSSADMFGKGIIIVLLILSVCCWAIIFEKVCRFYIVGNKLSKFDKIFWSGQPLDQLYDRFRRNVDNPLSAIFIAAMHEVKKTDLRTVDVDISFKIGQKDRLMQSMNLVRNREVEGLENYLSFLGSVGSYAPFIGLLGTVWGIMHSFQSVAAAKSFNIALVAGGISEALFATAVGLMAAIPAVAAYNYLAGRVNCISNRIDDFISELYTIISRGIDEEKM
jgi:biopolymer transport protein TolQ